MSDLDAELDRRVTSYRRTREQVERTILPLATSVEGARFTFQASLHGLQLRRGGYVALESDDGGAVRLGLITDIAAERVRSETAEGAGAVELQLARGSGIVVDSDGRPFHEAAVRPATAAEVGSWLERSRSPRSTLLVGELLHAPGVPAGLDAGGLGRHTFFCGQSGSGKTYALGGLLEQVLLGTSLPVIVLDPNSDYVGLGRVRPGTAPEVAARYGSVAGGVAVWRDDTAADHPLRLAFADLTPAVQAAVLGLDPLADREEYAALTDLLHRRRAGEALVEPDELLRTEDPAGHRLGQRAANLGVLDWHLWSPTLPSLVEELRRPTARCTVVDLGSLATAGEQRLVAAAVLTTLWDLRTRREPFLVVVDEAHNVGPAQPPDELSGLSAGALVQIAAEGRKYGLYLLLSTQRPHKLDENVVSQCDNLVLMRMSSEADLRDIGRLLSFVPSGLLVGATAFHLGEALVAGRLLRHPAYLKVGPRISEEGGADVPATWAVPPVA
ncbi:ATP-binding protein [Georgenia sp. SUBG003]|uniref:ATP-binding protein n=1 Tax=Georgenia sp. SUBG003 TaxID=1497974 RepID=UPI000693623B